MRVPAARARRPCSRSRLAGAWGLLVFAGARSAAAQQQGPSLQPELRADVFAARAVTAQLGAGATVVGGEYLRVGGDLGVGVVSGDGRASRIGARLDGYGRFHLDPFAESRWAAYLIGGGSYRVDARRAGRLYVLAGLGVEGPVSSRLVPAIEIALSGGVRISVALRRARTGRR